LIITVHNGSMKYDIQYIYSTARFLVVPHKQGRQKGGA